MLNWKRIAITLALSATACGAEALSSSGRLGGKADDPEAQPAALQVRSYEVLFTNPVCQDYEYKTKNDDGTFSPVQVTTVGGMPLTQKPKNVYCYPRWDKGPSAARESSPQNRLLDWIGETKEGDDVFLAYLSFSNTGVAKALCDAVHRGVKVNAILDTAPPAEYCGTYELIGHEGGIGFQHNKVILINAEADGPGDPEAGYMRMTLSSGNMSSGTVLHHENWHFIEVKRDSFFAQMHTALKHALEGATIDMDGNTVEARREIYAYSAYLNQSRQDLVAAGYVPESDMKVFFIPVAEDVDQLNDLLLQDIRWNNDPLKRGRAVSVDLAAHRFGHYDLIAQLRRRLQHDKQFSARMIADDDLYWLRPRVGEGHQTGDNLSFEAGNVQSLKQAGNFEIRYMETFHHGANEYERPLLHHSKYVLFRNADGEIYQAVFGAANLTGTGYGITDSAEPNFENIYFTTIPAVLEQFDTQYRRMWDGERAEGDTQDPPVATPELMMPSEDVKPYIP